MLSTAIPHLLPDRQKHKEAVTKYNNINPENPKDAEEKYDKKNPDVNKRAVTKYPQKKSRR